MMDTKSINLFSRTNKIFILAFSFYLCFINGYSQENSMRLKDSVSLDMNFKYGQLSNGFTYFIKNIEEPQSKLHLRLYNKAGSSQQDDDQFNVSHAVEHLAFKATEHFPLGIANSKRIDSLKMDMYDYISAFNGMKGTLYNFDAPTNNIEALEIGLLYFKDIAMGLKFKETDINSVRGEVWQELIMAEGDNLNNFYANSLMYSKLFPCDEDWFNLIDNKGNFSSEAVRRFYKDWYRPDLMGISIVGNIDNLDELENRIKETFSDFIQPKITRKKINCDSIYYSRNNQFVIVKREQDTSKLLEDDVTNIHLIYRNPIEDVSNKKQILENTLKFQFLVDMVAKRIYERSNKYNSFDISVLDLSKTEGRTQAMNVFLNVRKNREKQGMVEMLEVLHQLKEFGVSEKQWLSYKDKQTSYIAQTNSQDNDDWSDKFFKNYVMEDILSFEENENLHNIWEGISLEEINLFLNKFLNKNPEDIGIVIPSNQSSFMWDEKEIRSFIKEKFKKPLLPYRTPDKKTSIIKDKDIAKLKKLGYKDNGIGESGAREVILKNGVKVVLNSYKKESLNKSHKIKIQGYSPCGANSYPKPNYFSAINAAEIVRNSGVNGVDKFELNRFLDTTSLRSGTGFIYPYISNQESGIEALGGSEDLETMFQLIFLYFTKPNKDKVAFFDWKENEHNGYINPTYSLITTDFENKIGELTGNPWGKESTSGTKRFYTIAETDLDISYNIYQEIFGKADDFTFLISGNFEEQQVLSLAQKYLGNLPSKAIQNKKTFNLQMPVFKQGPSYFQFPSQGNYKMRNIRYGTRYIHKIDSPDDWKDKLKVEALGELLRQQLWALRFKKGYAVYDIKAAGIYINNLNRYEIISYLDCKPDEFVKLQKEVKQIYSDIKLGLFSDADLKKSLSRMYSLYETKRAMDPKKVNQRLYEHYRHRQPWTDAADMENFVKLISVADIIEVANKYCNQENFNEFVMWDKKIE